MSKGICEKCKSNANYNFEINCGLCNPCISEQLEDLAKQKVLIDFYLEGLEKSESKITKLQADLTASKTALIEQAMQYDGEILAYKSDLTASKKRVGELEKALQKISDLQDERKRIASGYDSYVDVVAKQALKP